MYQVIDKKNGVILFTGSLESCKNFIGMFELNGLVDIK